MSETAINEFIENPPMYMAIHWYGKVTVNRLEESYAVLCIVMSSSRDYTDGKLLAEQKLQHATSKAQA